jgi:prephenate dehydrogenase
MVKGLLETYKNLTVLLIVMVRIAIIGGSGEFGRVFARLFKEDGHEVVITGRDRTKGKRVAKELEVEFTNDNAGATQKADIVIISVYIDSTLEVIEEVAPHVRPGCLLMDFTSVKIEPCRAMEENAAKGAEIIGTHPMFGPRVASLEGQAVIVVPVRAKKWKKFLLDFLSRHKARVFETTADEHDMVMAVVQGLTHFAYISTASTLRALDVDVKDSRNFASPIYILMLDLIARIVGQSPQLYASIQMHNPHIVKVHRTFIEQASKLGNIVAEKDTGAFTKLMTDAAKHVGDLDASMGRSDKAILALNEELRKLTESVGTEVVLRHIYSGAVHTGVAKSIDAETVTLKTGSGKKVALKLSNIELLGHEEARKWKSENLPKKSQDFSLLISEDADEEVIKRVIEAFDDDVISCLVVDVYRGKQIPQGKKSITLRVETTGDSFEKTREFISGIGGVLR